jgi:hypothetical protein
VRAVSPVAVDVHRIPVAGKARLVVEILSMYARVRWLMARLPVEIVLEQVRGPVPADRSVDFDESLRTGVRLGRIVTRVLSPLPADSRCLVRSLVLLGVLERRGVQPALVIGVKPGPEFGAHAWLEQEGRPLLPTDRAVFRRLVEC